MYNDIKNYFEENKISKFRVKQLEDAIFKNLISNFEDITNFPKKLREDLSKKFSINSMMLVESHRAGDNNNSQKENSWNTSKKQVFREYTTKFVLKTKDGHFVESVLMHHKDGRRTVCVSCQVFCAVGCKFCATGANSFKRSLTADEIVEQVLFISRYLKQKDERVTNVVYMGMGEPFLNYDAIIESLSYFNDKKKFNIGARHITVSTSGIIPRIYEYANLPIQSRLAISLHAANTKLRSKLMPINDKYPLDELMKACDYFTKKTNKRVSYEYVLIKDINDSKENALELVKLLRNRLAHVNILVYNPHEFAKFKRPNEQTIKAFKKILDQYGIENSIRKSMGDDISGACGQLSGKQIKHS